MTDNITLEMICSIGNITYEFRSFENNKTTIYTTKPNNNYKISKSHGYCVPCAINEYNKIGLIYDLRK